MLYKPNNTRYENMKYVNCGNSGLKLPKLSLGLWHNFGSIYPYESIKEMIFRAFDMGITHFDLANNYGTPPGSAERNFGKVLNDHMKQYRDEMIISSKAGYRMWEGPYGEGGSKKYLISSLNQSLERLGLDYVDIFYSHRFDPNTPLEETMRALDQIVKNGKALYAGISNYNAEQTKKAVQILDDLGTPCLIHQHEYSMYERTLEEGTDQAIEKNGLGCIVFSPLSQGMLTKKYFEGIPKNSRASKKSGYLQKEEVTKSNVAKSKKLNNLAEKRGQTLPQMALAWVLNNPVVTSAIIGASSVKQLEENVATLDNLSFSKSELERIENIL